MLLAIDTSTRYAGVALWGGGRVVEALLWYSQRSHTAELMPAVERVLRQARLEPQGLECIGVALGPGGFSALRVGLSTAKGLALPSGLPVIGVGTLEMEAYPYADLGVPICPLLDVGRGEVAMALFQASDGQWRKLQEERACPIESVVESVPDGTILCGEAVAQRREYLKQSLGNRGFVVGFHTPAPRLWALAALAEDRLRRGEVDSFAALQPLYVRRPSIGTSKPSRKVDK